MDKMREKQEFSCRGNDRKEDLVVILELIKELDPLEPGNVGASPREEMRIRYLLSPTLWDLFTNLCKLAILIS